MTAGDAHAVRGWCPGALRPMQSGDGLIVRLRPRGCAIDTRSALAIADIAQRHGNGLIDLTRRANIQLRGVTPDTLTSLQRDLAGTGLLDDSAEREAIRNIIVSPLAGLDPAEIADLRPMAEDLERRLLRDPQLWCLPPKFGFVVDGGGLLSLDGERCDIRLEAVNDGGSVKVAMAVDGRQGETWLGLVRTDAAASIAVRIARAYLALATGTRMRMRDLSEGALGELRLAVAAHLEPMSGPPPTRELRRPLGVMSSGGVVFAVGLAVPFGRIQSSALHALAGCALDIGIVELRLSPWRTIYAGVRDRRSAESLLEIAGTGGFIVDEADPLLAIDACPGASGCASTTLDTRAAALQLANLQGKLGCQSIHVSGCSKGCARSKPADLVLVGAGDNFAIIRYDTAQGEPCVFLPAARLADLPALLGTT